MFDRLIPYRNPISLLVMFLRPKDSNILKAAIKIALSLNLSFPNMGEKIKSLNGGANLIRILPDLIAEFEGQKSTSWTYQLT